jgi:DNA ligase-1
MKTKSKEFTPMLASVFKPEKLKFPALASRKLDGIRCIIRDGVALSRSGKPIRNQYIQSVLGRKEFNWLDGELMVGAPNDPKAFSNSTSGVMSEDGEPDFVFHVFDIAAEGAGFESRLAVAKSIVTKAKSKHLKIVEHVKLTSLGGLDLIEEKWLMEGFEGVMLRSLDGPYKLGRSSVTEGHLLKVKRFSDAEAVIIDYVEEVTTKDRTPKNALGKFICRMPNGVEFGVGGGFSREERIAFWKQKDAMIGKICKYKYFEVGMIDAPRFPSFIGIRDEDDMS